jgi:hypothetical protein
LVVIHHHRLVKVPAAPGFLEAQLEEITGGSTLRVDLGPLVMPCHLLPQVQGGIVEEQLHLTVHQAGRQGGLGGVLEGLASEL